MGADGNPEKRKVLVVEDEPDLRELLEFNLRGAGYEVRAASSGSQALAEVEAFAPDVVLLDLMLPGIPGTEVCRQIRTRIDGKQPVVIMVTAKDSEIDRVVGFELGADDYVVKPFSIRELLLRIRVRLSTHAAVPAGRQRAIPVAGRRRFVIDMLTVDSEKHQVHVGTTEVQVSAMEMRLLVHLAEREGLLCSRSDLLTHVWNYNSGVTSRTVDTYVKRLRDKLGAASGLIQTIRGRGYRLATLSSELL
jgi:two-component system phosphate regulon response regulator PhoB